MSEHKILLPSKPKIVKEEEFSGVYEIDGLYPGYGHTLGNSLRRIILSSLPGSAITTVKIDGVNHEFSTINGVKEDVINILLNLKKIRIKSTGEGREVLNLKIKGVKEVSAKDIEVPGQVEILNKDQHIATITDKSGSLTREIGVETGIGSLSKEMRDKAKEEVGTIALDASFSPIRRASYEVDNMRVGDRTDFNKLRLFIETDGTITAREVLEKSIIIMIEQLKAIIGFKEEDPIETETKKRRKMEGDEATEFLKTRIESLDLSSRTTNALSNANIRTVGGLARKKEQDLLKTEGLGAKGIQEIKEALEKHGLSLK